MIHGAGRKRELIMSGKFGLIEMYCGELTNKKGRDAMAFRPHY
jgi:hypothetical protein